MSSNYLITSLILLTDFHAVLVQWKLWRYNVIGRLFLWTVLSDVYTRHLHGTVYLTVSVTAKFTPVTDFYTNSKLTISIFITVFLARDSIYAIARYMPSPVRLAVRPSHGWISQRRFKIGSRNLHHSVAP